MEFKINPLSLFAETYNCGAYGTGDYNENLCSTVSSSDSASLSAPGTGIGIETAGGIAGGLALIVLAFVILKSTKKKKRS